MRRKRYGETMSRRSHAHGEAMPMEKLCSWRGYTHGEAMSVDM